MKEAVEKLFNEQMNGWPLAKQNYAALEQVRSKSFVISGYTFGVQFNPARLVSSAAKVDAASLQSRPCFLCETNRPHEQRGIPFNGRYTILVNPFPIFPRHLTIPMNIHTPQLLADSFVDMLDLAEALTDYVVFYNGADCGASAPDHMHFQAGNKGFLPFEEEWKKDKGDAVCRSGNSVLWNWSDGMRTAFVIESDDKTAASTMFYQLYNFLKSPDKTEPMINVLAWFDDKWIICIFPRKKHRPVCYFALDDLNNRLVSPASVDMGGVLITPLEKDFMRITTTDIVAIYKDVCFSAEDVDSVKQLICKPYEE